MSTFSYLDNVDDWDTNELIDPEAHVKQLVTKLVNIHSDLDELHTVLRTVRNHLAKSMAAALVRSGQLDSEAPSSVYVKMTYEIAGYNIELSVRTNGEEPTVALVPRTTTLWSEVAKHS